MPLIVLMDSYFKIAHSQQVYLILQLLHKNRKRKKWKKESAENARRRDMRPPSVLFKKAQVLKENLKDFLQHL